MGRQTWTVRAELDVGLPSDGRTLVASEAQTPGHACQIQERFDALVQRHRSREVRWARVWCSEPSTEWADELACHLRDLATAAHGGAFHALWLPSRARSCLLGGAFVASPDLFALAPSSPAHGSPLTLARDSCTVATDETGNVEAGTPLEAPV